MRGINFLIFLFTLASLLCIEAYSFEIQIHKNLKSKHKNFKSLVEDVVDKLPFGVRVQYRKKIKFKLKKRQKLEFKLGHHFFWQKNTTILINPRFVKSVLNKEENYESKILMAIALVLDYRNRISWDRGFREITFWSSEGVFNPRQSVKDIKNHSNRYFIHELEKLSPKWSFVINFEKFFSDPEFKCRRPSINRYLSDLFNIPRDKEYLGCENYTRKFYREGDFSKGLRPKLIEVDPERIIEIHYVWGSPGDSVMGKFGHSFFRIVMCAPGERVTPDCRRHVDFHLMLSFAANIDDDRIKPFKGLTGKYNSRLFVENFRSTMDRYNFRQFQELYGVPLYLNSHQRKDFFYRALELHWAYAGDYKFLSNNCAVESLNLLKAVFPFNEEIQTIHAIKPKSIFNKLYDVGIAPRSYLFFPNAITPANFYYPSKETEQMRNFDLILPYITDQNSEMTFERYLYNTNALERRALFSEFSERKTLVALGNMTDVRLAFWYLERHIQILHLSSYSNKVLDIIVDQKDQFEEGDYEDLITGLSEIRLNNSFFSSIDKSPGSYGIPHIEELSSNDNLQVENNLSLPSYVEDLITDTQQEFNLETANISENISLFSP